ncbi:hypothetical protein HZH66_010043 [Vespula vulgaris]|uniref:Uncharacterized protein n=1 Tax=Vespula vulgaris TaxID=7454 RepID=A0A834JP19_VESVU|nr:hypothetical protein HZH66_010043 [Vespula vulgaris]
MDLCLNDPRKRSSDFVSGCFNSRSKKVLLKEARLHVTRTSPPTHPPPPSPSPTPSFSPLFLPLPLPLLPIPIQTHLCTTLTRNDERERISTILCASRKNALTSILLRDLRRNRATGTSLPSLKAREIL